MGTMKKIVYLNIFLFVAIFTFNVSFAAVEAPKNPNSAKECAICHYRWIDTFFLEGKGTDLVPYHSEKVAATPEMCFSCHDGSVKDSRTKRDKDYGHKTNVTPPANMKIPEIFPLDETGKVHCATCHTAHGVPSGGDTHETIFMRTSNKNSAMCTMCHTNKVGGQNSGNHPLDSMKQQIPVKLVLQGAVTGNPKNRVICETCHAAHGARGNKLTIVDNKNSELCVTCHNNQKSLLTTKHDLQASFPDEKNIKQQRPVESGPCGVCHIPHNSPNKRLWARQLPPGKASRSRFCLSCHLKGKVAEKVTITGTSHPLNVNPFEKIQALAASGKKLTLPLFDTQGAPDNNGNMTCATCHDPHGSKADSATAGSAGNIDSDTSMSFLRKRQQDMCGECHLDKNLVINSKHDMSKMAPDTRNILNRTPSESGLCGSCHLVHKGQGAFLWARELKTPDKNIVQDICNSCHNEKGMAAKKVIKDYSHPVNVSPVEKGLSTTLPLFDKDGKTSKKGMMTCLTCHDPHRWDPVKSMGSDQNDIKGNTRNSFLRLQTSPAPKLCENCHPDKAYVEKTDHDLTVTAPDYTNIINQTPAESGVCGVCHLVHNSENWVRLWAQDFGAGEGLMDMMCNSCHSSKGTAKNKVPQISSHPQDKLISSAGRNVRGRVDFFPMFHKSYGEPVTMGSVSCPSCHNAHQWDAGVHAKGNGSNIEGNATTSFLRSRSSIRPCKDCHGPDSLFRYKYFHKAEERRKKINSSKILNPGRTF